MREAGVIGGGSAMTGTHGTGHQGKCTASDAQAGTTLALCRKCVCLLCQAYTLHSVLPIQLVLIFDTDGLCSPMSSPSCKLVMHDQAVPFVAAATAAATRLRLQLMAPWAIASSSPSQAPVSMRPHTA
jgi:hypothetical protein